MLYNELINKTDPVLNKIFLHDNPEQEEKVLRRFRDFYEIFSYEKVNRGLEEIYSQDAYFRDSYKEFKNIVNIKKYFLKNAQIVYTCVFDIHDIVCEKGEYYIRWTMRAKFKSNKYEEITVPGMSHIRFNSQGKVIFHQNYCDSSIIFERFPVIGSVLRWIKSRL